MQINSASYLFKIPIMSKARPRSLPGQIRPYTPTTYRLWLNNMRAMMSEFWILAPLSEVSVLYLKIKGPARGDLDNIAGAILDAGTGLIWVDDRVNIVKSLAIEWEKASTKEQSIHLEIHWPIK